ncbi:uncharacterized protein DNG_06679 [Cephalotrichum gorgonifer]|uniref:C2H2-type domain-containing protein n=1 Tax=Cephalotrichum gorgonifer TaxID=2041049 RepID=A0AAE8N050_9PEZI|nr:uncharacterized protein DNG_06679 [Cephalotrichum gorgonifer]
MFSAQNAWQDASRGYQMSPEDLETLIQLAGKYGPINLMFFLRSIGESSRVSQPGGAAAAGSNVPSLTWSATDPSHSETASLMSQNTQPNWSESPDMAPGYVQPDVPGISDPSWSATSATPQPLRDPKVESPMSQPNLSVTSLGTASQPNMSVTSLGTAPTPRKAIECTMCFVEGIVVGFSRKSDFKKHLQNFHHTNTIWECQYTGCPMTFDFEKAYVSHVKAYHSDMHLPPNKARVETCPQLIFACGFRGCKDRVFEATSEEEAKVLRDKYFDHVAKHFDMGFCVAEWEYYTQIQNLLRQEAVKDMWKQCVWQKSIRNALRWQPRSSTDLKRLLECRHLLDMPRLLHWAWTLGGEPYKSSSLDAPEPPAGIKRPLKRDCPLTTSKHEALMKPALLKVAFPVSQQSFQFAIPPPPKPVVAPTVYLPDPRSSGTFSIKSNHSAISRPAIPDQEGWPQHQHQHPGSPFPTADGNHWGEGYNFAATTSEPVPHQPISAAHDAVDHPMGNVALPPTADQIQQHNSLHHHAQLQQPQQRRSVARQQSYPLEHQHQHQHHPHPQPQPNQAMHQYHHHPSQQWPASAVVERISPIEQSQGYEQHRLDMKMPKRPPPMTIRSMENLQHKGPDPGNGDGMAPPPHVAHPSEYEVAMRTSQLNTPTSYMHEVSMTG